MKTKSIARNRTREIDRIFTQGTNFRVYTLDNSFIADPVPGPAVRDIYNRFGEILGETPQDSGAFSYSINCHSNLWYQFEIFPPGVPWVPYKFKAGGLSRNSLELIRLYVYRIESGDPRSESLDIIESILSPPIA